jgi:hypothetical protein
MSWRNMSKDRAERVIEARGERYPSFPYDNLADDIPTPILLLHCCPRCGRVYESCNLSLWGDYYNFYMFECGGGWMPSCDLDGNPVWAGRCGQPLKQQSLAFTEQSTNG